jgi:hypothetical protein
MKLKIILIAIALAVVAKADVLISDFGTGFSSSSVWADASAVSNSATFTSVISPATNGGEMFSLVSPSSLAGLDALRITARVDSGNLSSGFVVTVYSSSNDYASASFSTSTFNASFSTATTAWVVTGAFNPASVIAFGISGGVPSGTSAFRMSFDSLSAVSAIPEPSTFAALIGLASLGFCAVRRRRRG